MTACLALLPRRPWPRLLLTLIAAGSWASLGLFPTSGQEEAAPPRAKPVAEPPVAGEVAPEAVSEKPADEATGSQGSDGEPETRRRGLVLESTSMRPKVYTEIPGAKRTVLAAAYTWEYGLKLYKSPEWRDANVDLLGYYKEAESLADGILERLEPRLFKDDRGVVDYAVLADEDPFLSSVILSKGFLEKFEKIFGGSVLVVALDRRQLYVFPELGNRLDQFGPALAEKYQSTPQPVSLEILRVHADGYEVIGEIEQ